jgi:hypothetical protein
MASSASIHVDLHSTRGLTESEAQEFAAHERRRQRAQGAFTLLLLALVVCFFGAAALTHLRAPMDDEELLPVDDEPRHAPMQAQLNLFQPPQHDIDNTASGAIGMPDLPQQVGNSEGNAADDGMEPTDSPKESLGLSGLGVGGS